MAFAPHPRLRVLVSEGDRAVRAILRNGLERAGVDVVSASNGTSALRLLVDHLLGLDLLVTGLELPVLDGRSLVRVIRAEGGEADLPILVVASAVCRRDRELLGRLGVTEIVEKQRGAAHVISRAVALARAGRDRRVGPSGSPGPIPTPVPALLARVAVRPPPASR